MKCMINCSSDKNYASKKVKTSKYLKAAGELQFMNADNLSKKVKIGILTNGNNGTLKKIGNKLSVSLENTFAFDSLVQLLAVAVVDSTAYYNYAEDSTEDIFKIALSIAEK